MRPDNQSLQGETEVFYTIVRWVVNILIRILFDIQSEGFETFPESGPVVICSNHTSWWDPCVIGCLAPRPVYFMAKEELFSNPIFAWVLGNLHAFPVNREKADIRTVRRSLRVLENGEVLGIFPEGTRKSHPEVTDAHAGAALLAMKGKAPVIPIAIRGTYKFRRTVRVACGKPFHIVSSTGKRSSDLKQGSEDIMKAIVELWNYLGSDEVTSCK